LVWDTGDDWLVGEDGTVDVVIGGKIQTAQISIDDPDGLVYDTVGILNVHADKYPAGITVVSWGFVRTSTTSSTLSLYEATDLTDGTMAVIETITTCTGEECEDDGSIANAVVDAGDIIVVDYNDVAEGTIQIWVTFYVNDN
jgi:hypothetical protein